VPFPPNRDRPIQTKGPPTFQLAPRTQVPGRNARLRRSKLDTTACDGRERPGRTCQWGSHLPEPEPPCQRICQRTSQNEAERGITDVEPHTLK
jgi:hypothetical protein